jgi:hypothetical protein
MIGGRKLLLSIATYSCLMPFLSFTSCTNAESSFDCSSKGARRSVRGPRSFSNQSLGIGPLAGAGRKKNVPNRASADRERKVAASGATPLDVMLKAMREVAQIDAEIAVWQAIEPSLITAAQIEELSEKRERLRRRIEWIKSQLKLTPPPEQGDSN